jgi:hypothetical protein
MRLQLGARCRGCGRGGQRLPASKLRGTKVLGQKNEKIDTLDDLIIGKGRVLFAIIQVGIAFRVTPF